MQENKLFYFYTLITLLLFPTFINATYRTSALEINSQAQSTPVFQQIAQIRCVSASDTSPLYSQPNNTEVKMVRWNPRENLIAIWCTNTPDIFVYDSSDYSLKYTIPDSTPQNDEIDSELLWSPFGDFLVKATKSDIDLWNVNQSSFKYITTINRTTDAPSVVWKPDEHYFAELESIAEVGKVNLYQGYDGQLVNTLETGSQQIRSILWSKDGHNLIAATWNNEIQMWDASRLTLSKTTKQLNEGTIAWVSDTELVGSYCSSTERNCVLWILDTTSWMLRKPFEDTLPYPYTPFEPSPDGKLLACDAGEGYINIFVTDTGKVFSRFGTNSNSVTSITWNPDGTKLATGGDDGVVRIWLNLEVGTKIAF